MFKPNIEPKNEHETVRVLDALDVICDSCTTDTKCHNCTINDIKNKIDNTLIDLVPLPDEY